MLAAEVICHDRHLAGVVDDDGKGVDAAGGAVLHAVEDGKGEVVGASGNSHRHWRHAIDANQRIIASAAPLGSQGDFTLIEQRASVAIAGCIGRGTAAQAQWWQGKGKAKGSRPAHRKMKLEVACRRKWWQK